VRWNPDPSLCRRQGSREKNQSMNKIYISQKPYSVNDRSSVCNTSIYLYEVYVSLSSALSHPTPSTNRIRPHLKKRRNDDYEEFITLSPQVARMFQL
jgi:hypothetical protein